MWGQLHSHFLKGSKLISMKCKIPPTKKKKKYFQEIDFILHFLIFFLFQQVNQVRKKYKIFQHFKHWKLC